MSSKDIIKRIEQVLKTDATFARESDFMMTHVPFKQLYDFVPDSGIVKHDGEDAHYFIDPKFYRNRSSFTEQDFLERMISDTDNHRFYLVQGNSGTGKSNLIRWTYYKYKSAMEERGDEQDQIIFIQRSYNSLKEAIKVILDYNILSEDRTQYYMGKIGGGSKAAVGRELDETILLNLKTIVKFSKNYDEYLSPDEYKALNIVFEDKNICEYIFLKKNGPIERINQRITGEGYDVNNGQAIFSEKDIKHSPIDLVKLLKQDGNNPKQEVITAAKKLFASKDSIYKLTRFFNSITDIVIGRVSSLSEGDLSAIFREIRKELRKENKRLTLFIEDINAYSGMDKELIEILIDEGDYINENEENTLCDFKSMVGSTDNFFDTLHQNIKMRITDSIVVLDDSMLHDQSKFYEFAARYINAINVTPEAVNAWYRGKEEMPIADTVSDLTSVELEGKRFSIFPFTKEAIINLFNCLSPSNRTPRGLLKFVLKHNLETWYTKEEMMFDQVADFFNQGVKNLNALKLPESVRLKSKDYSAHDQNYLRIWGFDYSQNQIIALSEKDKEIFEISYKVSENPIIQPPRPGVSDPPPKPETDSKFDKYLNHINEWQDRSNPNFVPRKDICTWIGIYILGQINWELEDILFSKAESVCKSTAFWRIEEQGKKDRQNSDGYWIECSKENAEFLRAITYWQFKGKREHWNFENGTEYQTIARAWLMLRKDAIIENIKKQLSYNQYLPYFVVRAKFGAAIANGQIKDLSYNSVAKMLVRENQKEIQKNQRNEQWDLVANALQKQKEDVDALFAEHFIRVIGRTDVLKRKDYLIDTAMLLKEVSIVVDEFTLGKNRTVDTVRIKELAAPIASINIYQSKIGDALKNSEDAVVKNLSIFKNEIGKASLSQISDCIKAMQDYLGYINKSLNYPVASNLIKTWEQPDAAEELLDIFKKMEEIKNSTVSGQTLMLLSYFPLHQMLQYIKELNAFNNMMSQVESQFAADVSNTLEASITALKKKIADTIDECLEEEVSNAD